MHEHRNAGSRILLGLAFCLGLALSGTPAAYADNDGRYQQHNLVSDGFVVADHTDSNLVNAWGIAFNAFGPVWVSDNGTGTSTVYNGAGTLLLTVTIPPASGAQTANPTGIVFNANASPASFPVNSSAAKFIFVTEDGVLAAWNGGPNAVLVHDNSASGTVYKGLAISAGGNGAMLYATDFHHNKIDVWDSSFAPVTIPPGAFSDPTLPAGFAPFGIQAINGNLYVTYAKQDADAHDDVAGKGLGFVDIFDPNGNMLGRFASRGRLNSPWGIALAPAGFGALGDSLLIGNFGDGRINAFDLATGEPLGQLKGADGHPLVIDGLWGLAFGSGFVGQSVNALFFTAGPGGEAHGLYGRIDPLPGERRRRD